MSAPQKDVLTEIMRSNLILSLLKGKKFITIVPPREIMKKFGERASKSDLLN